MSSSGFPEFDINDLNAFHNNNPYGNHPIFDEFDWNLLNDAGTSQPYTGADFQGDLNNYPAFLTPTTAPTSLHPNHEMSFNEGHRSPFYQGAAIPSLLPQPATTPAPLPIHRHPSAASPILTLSDGPLSLSPEPYATQNTSQYQSYAQPPAISNLDDLGFDFLTTAENSPLPVVHRSSAHDLPYENAWPRYLQSDLPYFNKPPFSQVTGDPQSDIPLPAPFVSSSGPQRTRQPAREARRYDPTKPAKEKANSTKDSWDQALVRFRAKFDTLHRVQYGEPSGGLIPATALAKINEFVKDDLKRSPLWNTKAGEVKRPRSVENYLKGLLRAICRVEPTPTQTGRSDETDTIVAVLSKLADELEAKLATLNQQPMLRQSSRSGTRQKVVSEHKEKQVKKNRLEKGRRDRERCQLERIGCLFKAPQQHWSKKDVLSLAVVFLLYGPDAFPYGFIEVRPIAPGL